MWMAGGGIQGGVQYGHTDDCSYNIVENPVHVNDLNATIITLMALAAQPFPFPFQIALLLSMSIVEHVERNGLY